MSVTGTIQLRSGTWDWHVMELREGGGGPVDRIYVWLRRRGVGGSRMHFISRAGSSTEMEDAVVALSARHPREREVSGPSGTTWLVVELSRPELSMAVPSDFEGTAYSVLFRSADGRHHGVRELPVPDLPLGEVTDEELLELAEGLEG